MIASAFTYTEPYAVLIMLGTKRVENRVPTNGWCAVRCAKSFCKDEYGNFVQWASQALLPEDSERIPSWGNVKEWPGRIVGACDYEARGRNDLRLEGDAGEVFRVALKAGADAVNVAHNHPSGDLRPSQTDLVMTKMLEKLAALMNMRLIDHLIVDAMGSAPIAYKEERGR